MADIPYPRIIPLCTGCSPVRFHQHIKTSTPCFKEGAAYLGTTLQSTRKHT